MEAPLGPGSVNISCDTLDSSDFNDSVNGPFTISERKRWLGYSSSPTHVPDAYSAYTVEVTAKIIEPSKRDEFLNKIKSGAPVDLGELTAEGFFLVNNPEDMSDRTISGGVKVLPDFRRFLNTPAIPI